MATKKTKGALSNSVIGFMIRLREGLRKDPIKSGRNWYGYAENNPLVLSDPNGLTPEDKCNSVEAAAPDTSDFARRYRNEHEDTEVGGYIYQNPNGTWRYTYAVGEPTQVDLKKAPAPKRSKHRRTWHTHPYKEGDKPRDGKPGVYGDPKRPIGRRFRQFDYSRGWNKLHNVVRWNDTDLHASPAPRADRP